MSAAHATAGRAVVPAQAAAQAGEWQPPRSTGDWWWRGAWPAHIGQLPGVIAEAQHGRRLAVLAQVGRAWGTASRAGNTAAARRRLMMLRMLIGWPQ